VLPEKLADLRGVFLRVHSQPVVQAPLGAPPRVALGRVPGILVCGSAAVAEGLVEVPRGDRFFHEVQVVAHVLDREALRV
jgi:hypothetical protein